MAIDTAVPPRTDVDASVADATVPLAFPQTNLQLFGLMRRSGYSEADLRLVRRAYDLAVRVFTAKYRGSGKPLLAHLVGTAGILAWLRAPASLVAAGVLHAAYLFGDFGDAQRGATSEKRARLRREIGREVEEIIGRYDALRWDARSIEEIRSAIGRLAPGDRDVLLLRLANELEDHLDLGVLYCGNAEERRGAIRSWLRGCVDLAQRLDQPALARAFERVFEEILSDEVPAVLRHPHDHTHDVRPLSCTFRPRVALRLFADRHPRFGRVLKRWI
ncbi:MAG TPA: HD domain-containing protein [Vicinamibacterales bacterium]|nr:HD domain-containing protein [Vicinamibacterales bacterium]